MKMVRVKNILVQSLSVMALLGFTACTIKHAEPYWSYAPDMHYSPALKAQKEGSMRPAVQGTIPRGFRPYEINSIEEAGKVLKNPLPRTKENMLAGKALFNVYCIVCHGKFGEGNGNIVPKFPPPPSLQSDKIIGYKDGQIFHVITLGQSMMPSYADKVDETERWQIIHYIRALQRAKHPTAKDLKDAEGFLEE